MSQFFSCSDFLCVFWKIICHSQMAHVHLFKKVLVVVLTIGILFWQFSIASRNFWRLLQSFWYRSFWKLCFGLREGGGALINSIFYRIIKTSYYSFKRRKHRPQHFSAPVDGFIKTWSLDSLLSSWYFHEKYSPENRTNS